MEYSQVLVKIRELNHEIDRYAAATRPEDVARRDSLLQVLELYLSRLAPGLRGASAHG